MRRTDDDWTNTLTGAFLGALVGSGLGLGACILIFEETLLFAGDTLLLGALICGVLGFVYGDEFIEWLKENWWWI